MKQELLDFIKELELALSAEQHQGGNGEVYMGYVIGRLKNIMEAQSGQDV